MIVICPECNISGGGCYCHEPPKVKYIPIDHEKELERWLKDLAYEVANDRNFNQ